MGQKIYENLVHLRLINFMNGLFNINELSIRCDFLQNLYHCYLIRNVYHLTGLDKPIQQLTIPLALHSNPLREPTQHHPLMSCLVGYKVSNGVHIKLRN